MQHMVLSLSTRIRGGLSVHSLSENILVAKHFANNKNSKQLTSMEFKEL
jgi:hypothetical protein